MTGIYKITSPTGRIYIGQSCCMVRRHKLYQRHKCETQTKLYRSILKYSFDKHKFEILEECATAILNERERYWQDFYDAASSKNLNCILTKSNGKKGEMSAETRIKASLAQLNSANSRKGAKHTDESRAKIKAARAKQIITQAHKDKISENNGGMRVILNTETGIYYRSIKDAALAHGIVHNYLVCSLRGRNKNNRQLIYA